MDLDAVRAFVAVVDGGQFQLAAVELGLTQQGVSKRVAALERRLQVQLLHRTARGASPTDAGRTFLPHAQELLAAADRATASVAPIRRPLRIDVIGRRLAPAALLQEFHVTRPGIDLDVVALHDARAAVAALISGGIDASFRAVGATPRRLPDGLVAHRVLDEPLHLLVGPAHALAGEPTVAARQLVGHRIWIPGIDAGTEWAAYYAELAQEFDLTIDADGPNFGLEPLMDALVETPTLATLVGGRTRLLWPVGHDLRRIPVRDPVPVYPHALLRRERPGPALDALIRWLGARRTAVAQDGTWAPAWA